MTINQMKKPIDEQQKLRIDAFKERLKKREIWINGVINESLVEILYANFINLQEQSKELPIAIVINSVGGNLFEAVVATDLIGTSPCHVRTVGLANVVSGGFIIFMGGKERICHDYTQLMMHSASFKALDKLPDIEDTVDYINDVQRKMANLFSYQTEGKTTPDYWLTIFKSGKNKWFSVEEALKLNIIHKVVRRTELIDTGFSSREPYTWDVKDWGRAQQ